MLEDSYLLIGLQRIVKDLDRETARIAEAAGLTMPQFMVLEALLHKGSMTVGEIKDAILSSNGTVPVIVNNLVKLDLVRRVRDEADHRRFLVELTERGREAIERVYPENDRMFREKFGVWTEEEKRELSRLIAKYHKNAEGR